MAKTLNRRAFLKRSSLAAAGAIGFPYFIRPSALGLNRAIAPSSRLQMAQIGCGSMGSGNMNSFLSLGSQVQVIAVCDVDSGHLDSAKNRVNSHYNNSDCRTYKDFRELLAKEQLDIVSHALPDHWHALVSVACAKQGIDIYGE